MIKRILAFALMALSVCAAYAQTITVYSNGTVARGTTRQLSAYVPLSPNTITWSVNGIAGGDTTYGTVSNNGLYTAPNVIPAANAVTVAATSTAYPDKIGAVTLTIMQPQVQLWSSYPSSIPAGSFLISLNGSNFNASSVVHFNGQPLATQYFSSTSVKATGIADAALAGTQVNITVVNPGLGGMTSSVVKLTITAPLQVGVAVNPSSTSVQVNATQQFSANVTNTSNTGVTWSVNNIAGGDATVGTISSNGFYTAPATVPSPAAVTVRATSAADPTKSGQATVTVQPPPPPVVTVSPNSSSVQAGQPKQFTANVTNTPNTNVSWSVNNIAGGNNTVGTISETGLYSAPLFVPNPANVTITATSAANPASTGSASLTITQPPGGGVSLGTPNLAAGRFLEQAAFGPTPAAIAHVKAIGFEAWLDEQFNLAETPINNPGGMAISQVQTEYLHRVTTAPDQLRQRVVAALAGIIVISANKNIYPDEIVPYLQILSSNAFGNYRTLLDQISHSSQMGKYLDLANSNKPTPGSAANENYARELMQLFTIGLYKLKPDGTLDQPNGVPVRAYTQYTVQQVALALTGWTYIGPNANNWDNFSGPLQAKEVNHATGAKELMEVTLPANQTAEQDMQGVLDWLFNHQNIAPFVAKRLILALVKSNPSDAYVGRISAVFAGETGTPRGDLRATVRAILLDAEARNDTPAADSGRLKDPIYHTAAFLRALGGSISATNQQTWTFTRMSQTPLAPNSVFGFYSPFFRVPQVPTLNGPEFQIFGPTEAVLRGNVFWQVMSNPGSDFPIDLSSYTSLAGNTIALIDAVDQVLLYGRMPTEMRQSLANAINAQSDAVSKARTALYLTSLSGFYAVQY